MADIFSPDEINALNALGTQAAQPATPVFSPDEINALNQLGAHAAPDGPTFQERAASEAFADTPHTEANAVGAGVFRDSLQLFTVDNSYHKQTFASLFNAAREVGYNHLFNFMGRLNSPYHKLDVRDGTEAYTQFVQGYGIQDVREDLARPLKNAFTMHAMIRNMPLHGAYRAVAAGSAGRKALGQFVQRVADTGTPLNDEQFRAQKLLESLTDQEWEEVYRHSFQIARPEARNEQEARLREPKLDSLLTLRISPNGPGNPDEFDARLRTSMTRFPQYTEALKTLMGPEWGQDYLKQYQTEAMLMKSGMLRLRQPNGGGIPIASEIALDPRGMLTPVDLVAPGIVTEIFEDAKKKAAAPIKDLPIFDDSGKLGVPEEVLREVVDEGLRDPAYAAQDALTPFEKNMLTPLNRFGIEAYKTLFEEIPKRVREGSVAVDEAVASVPFFKRAAQAGTLRITGDRDAAAATRTFSDAFQYLFRTSQEQGSFLQTLFNVATFQPADAQFRQEETKSFEAFRALNGEERQAAMKVFNTAGAALEQNFAAVDAMGDAGSKWLKGDNDLDAVSGVGNLIGWGAGKAVQRFVIQPIADVLDDPHMATRYALENVLIGAGAQGIFKARHAIMGRVYRANKLDLYLRRLVDLSPNHVRRIQSLARERLRGAAAAGRSVDGAFDDVVAVAKTTLEEIELGSLTNKTAATFVDKVKAVWPQIGEDMQPLSELINSRFTPGQGVMSNFVRKVAPKFQERKIDRALLQSIVPELNDQSVRAVSDILTKASARGFTHSLRRQRMRLYKELTGKANLTAAEKLGVLNGDAKVLAEVSPQIARRRATLDQTRKDLEGAMRAGNVTPQIGSAYQTALEEVKRLDHVESVWRGVVPQRDTQFLADLLRTVERLKTRKLPIHTRAMNAVMEKVYGVNSVQGEFLYNTFENVINTSMDAAENMAQLGRINGWKGAVLNRQYKVALEKARNAYEAHAATRTSLEAMAKETTIPAPELEDIATRTTQSQSDLARLEAEYGRMFKQNDIGETVFRLDPRKGWAVPNDAELFRWVSDDTLYTSLRADPALARIFPEAIFDRVPAEISYARQWTAPIDDEVGALQKDVLRRQKELANPAAIDGTLKVLQLRQELAKAGAVRGKSTAPYSLDQIDQATWAQRLTAAKAAGQISKLEAEIHGFIKNNIGSSEVDNFGRAMDILKVLDGPLDPRIGPADRRALIKVARHLKKRYGMEAPALMQNPSNMGRAKWMEFTEAQFDGGVMAPEAATAADEAVAARLAGLKDGSAISPDIVAARQAITQASDRLKNLYRRQAELADPHAYVTQLTPEGRKWIGQVFKHAGADEATEAVVRDASGFSQGVQALVQNRSGLLGAALPHLSFPEKVQASNTLKKEILHNTAIYSHDLELLNEAYWAIPPESRELLGLAMRTGRLPEELAKKHPKLASAFKAAQGVGRNLNDLFQFEGNFQASVIERLRATGYMNDELYQDLVKAGYDPQMHMVYETAKYIDDPVIRQVREARAAGAGARGQSKTGVDIDSLKFARSLDKYRLRVAEADGKIVNEFFDDEASLRDHVNRTYGPNALGDSLQDVTRIKTKIGEEITVAKPLGPEAQRALDTVLGVSATPEKRLMRWSEIVRNMAVHDYLTTMKLMTGLVFDDKQMTRLEMKHGAKILADYIQLPQSKNYFGNLAGHFVHRRVLADMNSMSHSYRQIEAWINGLREGFELFDASVPNELLRKTTGKFGAAFDRVNRIARFNLIQLNMKTRVGNHSFSLFSDHMLGTRLFSIRNLDVRQTALDHIYHKNFGPGGPDPIYREFVGHGFLDQGFEARNWGAPEIDAMRRMLHLPRHDSFVDRVRRTLKLDKDASVEGALKSKLAQRQKLLQEKLQAHLAGKDAGLLSQLEQQIVALDSLIADLDKSYAQGLAQELVGFYGTAGQKSVQRTSTTALADAVRESYSAIDTFYKYAFYRVLREKQGVPAVQAADLLRKYTQQFRDLPPVLHRLQDSPVGSFVVGFPAELLRMTANAMKERPGRYTAWLGIVPALNFTMASSAGIDPTRQVKHLQAMGAKDRFSAIRNYMTTLIIPNERGGISTTINLSNVLFPQAHLAFGENTLTHIYDNVTGEEPRRRGAFWDLLAMGASVGGAFVGNNPLIDTGATLLTGANPRTGRPIVQDPEEGGLWEKFKNVGQMLASQYLSPHTPIIGRDWQNLSEAYEAGYDPITGRPRGLTPGDVASRAAFNIPIRGDFARFLEKNVLGTSTRAVSEVMAGPGKQLSEGGPAVKSPADASNDTDILRSIIVRSAQLNGSADRVLAVQQSALKQAEDLYYRVAKEGNQPEVWEKIGKLLTRPSQSRQNIFGGGETTRPSADDVARNLTNFGRRGWDDQFSVLDPEEKMVAMIQADAAGIATGTLNEMARVYTQTDFGNARKGGDLVRLEAARRRLDQWLQQSRARKAVFESASNADVEAVRDWLDNAIEEAKDMQEGELDQIEAQAERDYEVGRPAVTP